ncbi:CHAP domain-containing protein [Ralstonia pseudosolanacearum]|uniref:CHAP domain-containing protein n=1 Tax=Ralstonia pseudosolanacearum TaxID=1310165 RepID=UPI003CF66033
MPTYDGNRAANYAVSHAQPHSTGNCAKYVRKAVEWGGITLRRTHYAKDYGRSLEEAGFQEVQGSPRKGDVVVIQPAPGHPAGHMAIYSGTTWVSDFTQNSGNQGFYPGPAYRSSQPPYTIYRHD